MTPAIRTARPTIEDARTIHRFICELAAYERAPDAVEVTPERLLDQLASVRPPFECLIARDGALAVGFALYFHNYSTWRGRPGLYVEDIYVPEAHRGRGIGRALFLEVGRIAVARGCARLELAVLEWNRPSIEFYERHGAVALDEWRLFRIDGEALERLGRGGSRTPWRARPGTKAACASSARPAARAAGPTATTPTSTSRGAISRRSAPT
jgi:GNAT superfamily N-acetyltransferase